MRRKVQATLNQTSKELHYKIIAPGVNRSSLLRKLGLRRDLLRKEGFTAYGGEAGRVKKNRVITICKIAKQIKDEEKNHHP